MGFVRKKWGVEQTVYETWDAHWLEDHENKIDISTAWDNLHMVI